MELYGYEDWGNESSGDEYDDPWDSSAPMTAERLAAEFRVDIEHARRTLEEFEAFRPQPVESLAVGGEALFDEPGFWADHLHSSDKDVAVLEAVFGLEPPQWLNPFSAEAWPTFTVKLPSSGVVLVVYRTDSMLILNPGCVATPDEEYTVDFWLAPEDGGPGMTLGRLSGHWFGPGLRWAELRGIVQDALPNRLAAAQRLLLLAPLLGDAAAGHEAVDWLARAGVGQRTGARGGGDPGLAEIIRDGCSTPEWRLWNGVWVCDGYYCHGVLASKANTVRCRWNRCAASTWPWHRPAMPDRNA